jgi:hypothetical protein
MKALIIIGALALSGCTINELRTSLDVTEEGCRTYLAENPESLSDVAKACRRLLGP